MFPAQTNSETELNQNWHDNAVTSITLLEWLTLHIVDKCSTKMHY